MKQQIQSSVDKLKGVWSQTGRGGQGKDSGLSLGLLHLHLVQAPSLWLTPEPPLGPITPRGLPWPLLQNSSGHAVSVIRDALLWAQTDQPCAAWHGKI